MMSILESIHELLFARKKPTASIAKERLQIILAHEKCSSDVDKNTPTWLPELQKEILDVLAKYVTINREDLQVNLTQNGNTDLLAINITLPDH